MVHVPLIDMEEEGLVTYTAASQQEAIKRVWLHFWGAVMSSTFIYGKYPSPVTVHWHSPITSCNSLHVIQMHDDLNTDVPLVTVPIETAARWACMWLSSCQQWIVFTLTWIFSFCRLDTKSESTGPAQHPHTENATEHDCMWMLPDCIVPCKTLVVLKRSLNSWK